MPFLHREDFENLKLTNCPPSDYKPKIIETAFRWVYDDIDDSRNFVSQYHKNPKRFLDKNEKTICSGLALSMFDSIGNAQARFYELREILQEKAYNTLGTKIAVGTITESDGVNSETDENGHFNHHLTTNTNYNKRFKIIELL
jgi:phosphatidate phosphatase APP1